jgi:hypothetical protein
MIRAFLMLLLVASSVLWARDIDESRVDAKSLMLVSVPCKDCNLTRGGVEYIQCQQNNEIVEYGSGPMGGWKYVDGVRVFKGNTRGIKPCLVRFSFSNGFRLGMTKDEVLKKGLAFKQESDSVWIWEKWKRLGPTAPDDPNDWHDWQGYEIRFCKNKVCNIYFWHNQPDSGP